MAKYLLDTTVLIEHLRGQQKVTDMIIRLARQGNELGVCCINIAELYAGLSDKERTKAEKLTDSLNYYETSKDIAKMAGCYRFDFVRKGITLTTSDTIVAAIAISYGAILITANIKDYPMKEIELLQQP